MRLPPPASKTPISLTCLGLVTLLGLKPLIQQNRMLWLLTDGTAREVALHVKPQDQCLLVFASYYSQVPSQETRSKEMEPPGDEGWVVLLAGRLLFYPEKCPLTGAGECKGTYRW